MRRPAEKPADALCRRQCAAVSTKDALRMAPPHMNGVSRRDKDAKNKSAALASCCAVVMLSSTCHAKLCAQQVEYTTRSLVHTRVYVGENQNCWRTPGTACWPPMMREWAFTAAAAEDRRATNSLVITSTDWK